MLYICVTFPQNRNTKTNKQTNNCAITKPHVTSLFLSLCHLSWCSGLPFLVCTSVGFQVFQSGSHRLIFINSSVMQYLKTSSSLDTRHDRYFFSGGNQALQCSFSAPYSMKFLTLLSCLVTSELSGVETAGNSSLNLIALQKVSESFL